MRFFKKIRFGILRKFFTESDVFGSHFAQFRSELERIEQTMPENGGAPAARDMEKRALYEFHNLLADEDTERDSLLPRIEERKQERIRFRLLSSLPGAEARSRSLNKQLVCSFPSLLYLFSCWSELFYRFLW